jgi:hypothetical protein
VIARLGAEPTRGLPPIGAQAQGAGWLRTTPHGEKAYLGLAGRWRAPHSGMPVFVTACVSQGEIARGVLPAYVRQHRHWDMAGAEVIASIC